MPFDLSGHRALVTGGSQGVGAAIAVSLANSGADVLIHGLHEDDLANTTIERCRNAGVEAAFISGDLADSSPHCVESLFNNAIERFPNIDLLVNNAGTFIDKPFLELDFESYQRTMNLNVTAGFFLSQAFAKHWIKKTIDGRILFTGSINGQLAEPDHAAYDTSKGAVLAMIKTLCVALAPHGIRVNGVAPGLVKTPLTGVLEQDSDLNRWMQLHTPNGRVPGAEVCGGAATFLLSDEAEHIQGQMLLVDGGMSIWQQPDLPDRLRGHLR